MPSNLLYIDSNFPSFTGEETPEQQIRALHNYLFQLREGLQYSLQNLTADNFNATALQNLTAEQKNEVASELQKVYALLDKTSTEIKSLSGRISDTESLFGRVTAAEEEISYLDKRLTQSEEIIESLETATAEAEEKLESFGDRVEALEDALPQIEQTTQELQEEITGEDGLQDQVKMAQQEIQKISDTVQVAEDGSATVGSEGKPLYLVGQVYINGVLYK